jgi:MinD-like ATPase involved in chromosome partitioning or flagellar assembly
MKISGVSLPPAWNKILSSFPALAVTRVLSSISQLLKNDVEEEDTNPWDWILIGDLDEQNQPVWELLHSIRNKYLSSHIVLFLKESTDPLTTTLLKRLAEVYRIRIAPYDMNEKEFQYYLDQSLQGTKADAMESNGTLSPTPLIVGWGTRPGVGVTTLLLEMAMILAKKSKLNIGFLDLNFRAPDVRDYLGFTHTIKDFLFIQSDLSSKLLMPQALRQAMIKSKDCPNLSFLLASNRREYAGLVTKDEIDELLRVSRDAFDIVFVDVSSYPDNAATLRALKNATERWIITDPRPISFQSAWRDWYENVFSLYGLELADFQLIVNKSEPSAYPPQTIARNMGVTLLGGVPYIDALTGDIDLPEMIRKQDVNSESPRKISMDFIVEELACRLGWEEIVEKEVPLSWKRQIQTKLKELRGALG